MLKNLGVKARRTMRAFLGTTVAAAFCAVVSPALAGSVTQPGETIGLAAGAPLPEGVYFVNTLNWGVRKGENGAKDVTLGVNIPVLAWATPTTIAGGRLQLLGALPALEVGVQDADHDSGLYNPFLAAQLAWDLGSGFGVSYMLGIYLPVGNKVSIRRRPQSGRLFDLSRGFPVPWQQIGKAALRQVGDAGEDVGEPDLGIDVVHLRGDDQTIHDGRPLAAPVASGEEPGLASKSDAAQGALGGVVCQAYPAIAQEAGEAVPACEHVVDRLGDVIMAGQARPLGAHPRLQVRHQRGAQFRARGQAFVRAPAVDRPLDVEQPIDPPHCLQRQRRDRRRPFAASGAGRDVGQDEELAPPMAPA
jgi:hypothetical protein